MTLADKGSLKTIASGLIPDGFDAAKLTPDGRDEVRAAIDAILELWDHRNTKLGLALKQLDQAAAEIERLRAVIKWAGEYADGAMEGAGEPEFSIYSEISSRMSRAQTK